MFGDHPLIHTPTWLKLQRSGKCNNTPFHRHRFQGYLMDKLNVLHNFVPFVQIKKREKHPWRSLLLACNFTKSNTPPWVFFTFFKLYRWYKIAQRITIYHREYCFYLTKWNHLVFWNYVNIPDLIFDVIYSGMFTCFQR